MHYNLPEDSTITLEDKLMQQDLEIRIGVTQ
jgi:hypothetical protein